MLTIDPEFHALCPPLSAEEYTQLEANLLAEGCQEPLVVWQEAGVLLDGHNRYALCQAHALPFDVHARSLPSREDAINWIINNQLGRRNLTEEQKSYLRGKRYNREKKQGARTDITSPQNEVKSHTAERLAEEYHVAPATVERDAQFADALDTLAELRGDLREAVLTRQTYALCLSSWRWRGPIAGVG